MDGSTSTDVYLDTGAAIIILPDAAVAMIISQVCAVNGLANSGNI